jgi:glycosyltransferase involved in cell wall biosynthesis
MKTTIQVLHILYELRSSGAEIMLKNAAPYWKKEGVVLHVLSTAQVKGSFFDDLIREGIIIHHIPYVNSLNFIFKLNKLIHQHHFDVVQIHVEKPFLTYSILARLAGVPVIIRTIHSTFLFDGLTKYNRSIRRWIVRVLGVIQVSVSAAIQKNEQLRYHNPTLQINNWYDDSSFYPPSDTERTNARNKFMLSEDQKVIISVGNCAPVKNHESIIRALAILKDKKLPVEYWHIGEEDQDKLEQNLVEELNLISMVKFWGRQIEIRDFLWAADVYVMPSFHEGLSIAMLEAIATQIPVVLAKSPGLEQWEEFYPEIIYSDTKPGDLANKLSIALQKRKQSKGNDSSELTTNFCIDQGVKKYLALYESKK